MTPARTIAAIITVVFAIGLGVWYIADSTIPAWLIRGSWAGATVAGIGVAVFALAELLDSRRTPRP